MGIKRIKTYIRLFVVCVYLTACFRHEITQFTLDDYKNISLLSNDRDIYCDELSLKLREGAQFTKQLPSLYTAYGKCLETGFTKNNKVTLPNHSEALKMYKAAAQCNEPQAISILKSRNEPIPEFSGRKAGVFFFPPMADQDCGYRSELTGMGYILIAPIAIPVGAVLAVAAILTLPLCAITSPIHGSKCM